MKHNWLLTACFIATCLLNMSTANAEGLDFVAEHLLEVPMDLRYESHPKTPIDLTKREMRVDAGYGNVGGNKMVNELAMIGFSEYFPLENQHGLMLDIFYDQFGFSGSRGAAYLTPSFGKPDYLPNQFDVNVNNVSGDGFHAGISATYVIGFDSGARLQTGLLIEKLDIGKYQVQFSTTNLVADFDGFVDYAASYSSYTPFVVYEGKHRTHWSNWTSGPSAVFALPLPRKGFAGRFSGADFDYQNDTSALGNGKHIPDGYFGVGYFLESNKTGLRIDIGASLFSYLSEPKGHRGVTAPLLLNVSMPL